MDSLNDRVILLQQGMILMCEEKAANLPTFSNDFENHLFEDVRIQLEQIKQLQLEKRVLEDKVLKKHLASERANLIQGLKEMTRSKDGKTESILMLWHKGMQRIKQHSETVNEERDFIISNVQFTAETTGMERLVFVVQYETFCTEICIQYSSTKWTSLTQNSDCDDIVSKRNSTESIKVDSTVYIEGLQEVVSNSLLMNIDLNTFLVKLKACIKEHIQDFVGS